MNRKEINILIKISYKNDCLSFYKNGKRNWTKINVKLEPSRYIYIGYSQHEIIECMSGSISDIVIEYDINTVIKLDQLMENQ